jgi:hypothetical protein
MAVDPTRAAPAEHAGLIFFCSARCRKVHAEPALLDPRCQDSAAETGEALDLPMHPQIVRQGPAVPDLRHGADR